MKLTDLGSVELQVGLICDGCGELVPINGPRLVATCPGCQTAKSLDGALRWQDLLDVQTPSIDVFKFATTQKEGAVQEGTRASVKLTSTRAWPKCACGRRFEATKLAGALAGGVATIACPSCRVEMNVDRPPPYFRTAFPAVLALIAAEILAEGPSRDAPKKRAKPVVMACTKCRASIQLDGATRNVPCPECGAANVVPDALWLTLHPTPRRAVWWALFDRSRA
jgi:Zn finger protein HypA/HybF involved in hydrogenase expression